MKTKMVLKEYQERLVTLVKDTLTLLCKNGLEYSSEFAVEGLLGVTLDKDEVFLIPIHEFVKDKVKEPPEEVEQSEEVDQPRSPKRERKKKRRHHESTHEEPLQETTDNWETNSHATHPPIDQDDSQPKRPRDDSMVNVKSEDIVVIKEEDDDEYDGNNYQDNSMDNTGFNRTDTTDDGMFFSQPGTSQDNMNFALEQLPAGTMGSDADMSQWLQQQAEGGSQGEWQGQPGTPGQKQQWQCDFCEKSFHSQWLLKRHRDGVHLKVRLPCVMCGRTYSQKAHLVAHQRVVHPECFTKDNLNANQGTHEK